MEFTISITIQLNNVLSLLKYIEDITCLQLLHKPVLQGFPNLTPEYASVLLMTRQPEILLGEDEAGKGLLYGVRGSKDREIVILQ